MAKHGKSVLIVDCDFIGPGLSGMIENPDDYGFLDLLLYGSSLRSISHPTGIDGVNVAGAGSFPVSKTIPFALGEFSKVEAFLSKYNDAVIYCSTLYTDQGEINPLCTEVDGIILGCRIEEMEEGQLQRCFADLGSKVPPVDLICFCDKKDETEQAGIAAPAAAGGIETVGPGDADLPVEPEPDAGPEVGAAFIEKTEEIEEPIASERGKFNIPRAVTIAAGVIIIGFITWWIIINRSIEDKQTSDKMTELVRKQRDVRDMAAIDTTAGGGSGVPVAADTAAGGELEPAAAPGPGGVERDVSAEPGAEDAVKRTADEPPAVARREADESPVVREAADAAPRGVYTIHVASFKLIDRAGREKEYFEGKGFSVRVIAVEINGEEWFRVYVGEYATRDEARRARDELMDVSNVGYTRIIELERIEQ
jgi:cell division protein FtsN